MIDKARFAYEGLDRTIHERARLSLLTSLIGHPRGLLFNHLKELCGLTDGNLSRHLGVLQEAGLVEVTKGYEGNRPHTSSTRSTRHAVIPPMTPLDGAARPPMTQDLSVSTLTSPAEVRGLFGPWYALLARMKADMPFLWPEMPMS